MTRLRKTLDQLLAISGIFIVFLVASLVSDINLPLRIGGILVGVLLIEAGIWNLSSRFLPSDRKYLELRAEVDGFIERVRVLNDAALEYRETGAETSRDRISSILGTLHASVDRMAELAGKRPEDEPLAIHEVHQG